MAMQLVSSAWNWVWGTSSNSDSLVPITAETEIISEKIVYTRNISMNREVRLIQSGSRVVGEVYDRSVFKGWRVPVLNSWFNEGLSLREIIHKSNECEYVHITTEEDRKYPNGIPLAICFNRALPQYAKFAGGQDLFKMSESNIAHHVFKNLPVGTYTNTEIEVKKQECEFEHGEIKYSVIISISRNYLATIGCSVGAFVASLFISKEEFHEQYAKELNRYAIENMILDAIPEGDVKQRETAIQDFRTAYARCSKITLCLSCDRKSALIDLNGRIWVINAARVGYNTSSYVMAPFHWVAYQLGWGS